MIWGVEDSTILGLAGIIAGLLTAATSFWWNYKTRALPHREFLYQKQIEAYMDLATDFSRSIGPCYDYLVDVDEHTEELSPEGRKELEKLTRKAHDDVRGQLGKSAMILPVDVSIAISKLLQKLSRVHKSGNVMQMAEILIEGEFDVYNAVRKNAGVEPLTKDMLQAFGQHV